jgi:hypothetical protein
MRAAEGAAPPGQAARQPDQSYPLTAARAFAKIGMRRAVIHTRAGRPAAEAPGAVSVRAAEMPALDLHRNDERRRFGRRYSAAAQSGGAPRASGMKFACIDRPCHTHLSLGARRGARRSEDPADPERVNDFETVGF